MQVKLYSRSLFEALFLATKTLSREVSIVVGITILILIVIIAYTPIWNTSKYVGFLHQ